MYQCLVAHLERVPNDKEITKALGTYAGQNLDTFMTKLGSNRDEITTKVLEDVNKLKNIREKSKARIAYYRQKHENETLPVTPTEKKIEDKKIEEEIREYKSTEGVISFLLNLWKSVNPEDHKIYGFEKIRLFIEKALALKQDPKYLEKRIRENKGAAPWDLFPPEQKTYTQILIEREAKKNEQN